MDARNLLTDEDINYMDMFLSCAIEKSASWLESNKNKGGKYPEYVKIRNYETGFYDIYKFDPSLLEDTPQSSEDPNYDPYEDVDDVYD